MRYGSVCSGIEAATRAWQPLGWEAAFFSEIEAFPSAVLAHHYGSNMPGEPLAKNGIPNYGDFTQIGEDAGPIDLLVGGTPCQSFSVAGKRLGLDDPRGNLALEYLSLARRLRARWIVWENVPGVVSSVTDEEDGEGGIQPGIEGREAGDEWIEESDFATFLSFVRECGYGFAYRVLDAQYVRVDGFGRAVPQRRRRVFVVGYLGDWRRAAAVLLEPQGMRGDSAPRREQGKGVATDVVPSLTASGRGTKRAGETRGQDPVVAVASTGNVAHCLNAGGMGRQDYETETMVAFPITAGMAASAARMPHEQGALVPVAFAQNTRDEVRLFGGDGQVVGALAAEPGMKQQSYVAEPVAFRDVAQALTSNYGKQADNSDTALGPNIVAQHAVAFDMRGREGGAQFEGPHDTANIRAASGGSSKSYVAQEWAVRRLTPTECERLQGFPEIRKNVKINIWLEDKSQQFAGAETQCITSPSSVSIAGESVSSRSAKSAKQSSIKNRQGLDLPVVLHVLLNLERGAVEIHKAGRCLWSASIAEKQSLSPLHMPIDAFARLIAQITESAEKEAPVGREGSLANTPHSTHPVSGRSFVNVSGHEIERHAEGAAPSTDTLSRHTTSTTSDCGQSSPNSALTMTTLCCSVVAAIGSFIPEIMSQGNSFSVTVEAVRGFTNVPWGKKDTSPDGPRYRALGNSMAVNCMRWIGRRIEMVEKITKGEAA